MEVDQRRGPAFVGVLFRQCVFGRFSRTLPKGAAVGFYNSLLVDRFASLFLLFLLVLFLFFAGGRAIAFADVGPHYLDVEDEHPRTPRGILPRCCAAFPRGGMMLGMDGRRIYSG